LRLQLLSAVAYLHDRWVMHRDIKLSNLLFTHQARFMLFRTVAAGASCLSLVLHFLPFVLPPSDAAV
jgi:serine/threonine protein kinase